MKRRGVNYQRVGTRIGIGDGFLELYEIIPNPEADGPFIMVFREKRKKEAIPILCGITKGGIQVIMNSWKAKKIDPTETMRSVEHARKRPWNMILVSSKLKSA